MQLKQYQIDTLDILRRFLEEARIAGPKSAYETIIKQPDLASRLGGYARKYVEPLKELPDVPYACLRLPTGGGKTILAAHAVALARDAWLEKDYPLVLWLVPTKIIRQQTVEALKNCSHAYRKVLDEAFSGRVRVFDIADFTHIRPHDLRNHCCIVVGTIQALRVKETEGRKVYAHHEELEPHFSKLPMTLQDMEILEGGGVKFSFANLMHLHRPLMIVDEAHNAVTGLTREMQKRINPAAIIEFSATPRPKSNILYNVTAEELKREQMVKLPIMLSEHDTWQNAVSGAIAMQASLSETAKDDPGYVRPIVLFQAQRKNQEVTVKALKKYLIEEERISEEKIAVATGAQRELDNINLFDPDCPIQYIITVQALKEGWDCSFAYIFCSVSRIQSAKDVEQLLGRVLRMPYAARRKAVELNRAYAFLSEPSFGEAARSLVDKLVAMGFDEEEARDNIEQVQPEFDFNGEGSLFGPVDKNRLGTVTPFRYTLPAVSETLSLLRDVGNSAPMTLHEIGEGQAEIVVNGPVGQGLEDMICQAIPETEHAEFSQALRAYRRVIGHSLSPAECGKSFNVPRLMASIQGELVFADTDVLMEFHDWSLLNHPARLEEHEFNIHETARSFEIDLDGKRISYKFAGRQGQLSLDVNVEGWTQAALVLWLDRQVRQPDISQVELFKWLSKLVTYLINGRQLSVSALMRCKFVLARKIRDKIAGIRQKERKNARQANLFSPEAEIEVSFNHTFAFRDEMYQGQRWYRGRWKPQKHFLGADRVPVFDGADGGEEEQCAQIIDSLPGVRYWIRNVARHPDSFYLPMATGKFYPDFVVQMEDNRLLVVEYKGAHIADSADTAEKRTIGELWQRASEGKCLFIVVEMDAAGRDMRQQLMDSIT